MGRRILHGALVGALALSGAACAGPSVRQGSPGPPTTEDTSTPDYGALIHELAPLVEPLGWEVHRAYRSDAFIVGVDADLVNIYLRPAGDEPSDDEYVADALLALRSIASHVFGADPLVSALDLCLQRANHAPVSVEVEPALRMLAFRSDLEPLLASDLALADLAALSQAGRLALYGDPEVERTQAWTEALQASRSHADAPTGSPATTK